MYAEEQKESFIEEYLCSKIVAETSLYALFRKTEDFERKFNKDVSDFNKEEIISMLKGFKSRSVNSLLNYVIILKHYSRWVSGIIGQNEYESIGKHDVINFIDKEASVLLNREDIDEIENQLLNWSDKAIVELLWNGIAGQSMKDIYSLSRDNVDFDNKIIITETSQYPLTKQLEDILIKAFDEDELISYGNTMRIIPVKGIGCIYKERANSTGISSDDAQFRYIYRKILIFRNYLDMPNITMKNIQASGLWHYIQIGMSKRGLGLREFLKTKDGEILAKRYGFGDYWVDNIASKYDQYN